MKRVKKDTNNSVDKEWELSQYKLLNMTLNTFIFKPCREILMRINNKDKESKNETNNVDDDAMDKSGYNKQAPEYYELIDTIIDTLLKSSTKGLFSELRNDYKAKEQEMKEYVFERLCLPRSQCINLLDSIFEELIQSHESIPHASESLSEYDDDFTLATIKELTKNISERGNEEIVIPMRLKDLKVLLEKCKCIFLDTSDPIKVLLVEEMNDIDLSG